MSMINFKPGNAAITINKLWTDFYATATAKLLTSQIQYEEDSNLYYIYILDGNVAYVCNIYRGTVPPNSVHNQTQNDLDKAAWEAIKSSLVELPIDPTIKATIKGSSQTAGSGDTSLVVALSPNSNSVNIASGYVALTSPGGTHITTTTFPAVSGSNSLVVQISPDSPAVPVTFSSASVSVSSGYITLTDDSGNQVAVKGSSSAATISDKSLVVQISPNTPSVPVTISSNVGITSPYITAGLALDTTLTGGTQQTKLTDGTHLATIKASNTPAVLSDTALVVASAYITAELAKDSSVTSLSGKFGSLGQKTMAGSAPVVIASDQSNLNVALVSGYNTVVADIGTTNGLALDATLTSGYAKSQIVDGNGNVPAVMSGYTAITTSNNSLVVQISPNQAAIPVSLGSGSVSISSGYIELGTSGAQVAIDNTTPGSGEYGLVVRNIPSGTQTVSGTVGITSAYITGNLALDSTVSTMSGKLPASVGQKTMSSSLPVVIASDQSNVNVALVSGYNAVTVSGTVDINSGYITGNLALDSTLTSGYAKTQLVDGSGDVVTIKAGSTASVVGDTSLVVQISPNQAAIPVTMTQADRTASGSITSTQTVSINSQGTSAVNILVTGTWTGTLTFEGSVDGSTWNTLPATNVVTNVISTTTTANGTFEVSSGGYQSVRIRGNSVATGTATIAIDAGVGVQNVALSNPLPAGTNVIGAVSGVSHKGMLFPRTISTNYVIATACAAKFTSGTQSYSATYTYKVVSPAGGDVSWNYADGGSDTFAMMPGYVYEVAVTQINASGTTVNDLQIIV